MLKKLSSLLMLVLLLGATLGACTPATEPVSPKSTEESTGTLAESAPKEATGEPIREYPITTEPTTLSYWSPLNQSAAKFIESYAENPAYQEMEKRTGITIDFIHPAIGQETEQYNLLMVSGSLPDMMTSGDLYKGGEFQGMYDGVFADITDNLPTYAPDYYRYIKDDDEFFREVSDDEGRIVAFYAYKPEGDPPFHRVILRQDTLDRLGKKVPETIAEYEDLFAAMLADGLTPFVLPRNGYAKQFTSPFGVLADTSPDMTRTFFKDLDGQIYFGQVRPEFKEYLALMNSWYEKGYISKDFAALDATQINTLFDTETIGTFFGPIVGNFNRGKSLGFEVTSAPYPRMNKGDMLHLEDTNIWPLQGRGPMMATITKDCKTPEIAMRWLNYGYTEAGAELMNWGVEGINWNWEGDKRIYNDLMLNNEKFGTEEASYIYKMHFAPKATEFDTVCHANLLKSEESLASRFKWADDPNVDSAFNLPPYQFTTEEQNRLTAIMGEVSTYTDEMVLKFITGAESLDAFDAFVSTVEGMGLSEAITINQEAYTRYLEKGLE